MSGTIDAIGDRVIPSRIVERRRNATREWASGMRARVMGPVHGTEDRIGSVAGRMADGVSHAADQIGDPAQQVQRATAGSPLIAGAVAFGLGALLAVVLPETAPERTALQKVQPQVDAATDAIKEAGEEAMATAKSSAQDATQEVKAVASEHARQVADEARQAGQGVKESTSS